MKVKTEPMKDVMQREYDEFKEKGFVRNPCTSIIFLRRFNTIGDLKNRRPESKVVHCPSDIFY